jgi:hypothetical protein
MDFKIYEDNMTDFITECLELTNEWKLMKIGSFSGELEQKYGNFYIIHKNLLGGNKKPNLLVMAGTSKKSFCNSGKIVVENIDQVK